MIRAIRTAYGAGYRAGMAKRPLVRPGGTRGIKVLKEVTNPYPPHRFVLNYAWFEGWRAGTMEYTRQGRAAR